MTVCNLPLGEYSEDTLGSRGHKCPCFRAVGTRAPINTPVQYPWGGRLTELLPSPVELCKHSLHSPVGSARSPERVPTISSLPLLDQTISAPYRCRPSSMLLYARHPGYCINRCRLLKGVDSVPCTSNVEFTTQKARGVWFWVLGWFSLVRLVSLWAFGIGW
jgi:hypothetical protein